MAAPEVSTTLTTTRFRRPTLDSAVCERQGRVPLSEQCPDC